MPSHARLHARTEHHEQLSRLLGVCSAVDPVPSGTPAMAPERRQGK